MKYRKLGKTDLNISEVGFGAWGIGGPAKAGNIPIGWGKTDDIESKKSLIKAKELGINFFDTADFYGFGHSEKLIGEVFSKKDDVIIASKVGHRLDENKNILLDYSKKHIIDSCEQSLLRLKRDTIDLYQLHSAKINHLKDGECIEAMDLLKQQGKIRFWGISLNTFNPFPEAEFFFENNICDSFQLVFNIINQKALPLIHQAAQLNIGIIARMPLQFGLLTGKFDTHVEFEDSDHRKFRLNEKIISEWQNYKDDIWDISNNLNISKTELALSYPLAYENVSTIIPGIRTVKQAIENTKDVIEISEKTRMEIFNLYKDKLSIFLNYCENNS